MPMTIYDEIHLDHLKLIGLIDKLLNMPDHGDEQYRTNLIHDIRDEFLPHARAEERILYNAMQMRKVRAALLRSAFKQHREAEKQLRTLLIKDDIDADWRQPAENLRDILAQHIREEEMQLFPLARQIFSNEECSRMSGAFVELKGEIRDGSIMAPTIGYI